MMIGQKFNKFTNEGNISDKRVSIWIGALCFRHGFVKHFVCIMLFYAILLFQAVAYLSNDISFEVLIQWKGYLG